MDPLADFEIDMQTIDIERWVSVYHDKDDINWWTKAWFNGHYSRIKGEYSEKITRDAAIMFIHNEISKDEWLSQYYPKQMEAVRNALSQTREQVINQYKQAFG